MLVPLEFGYVHSLSTRHRDPSGSLPRGMPILLVEAEGMFQSHPGFSSLPTLPSGTRTPVSSPAASAVPATAELQQRWLWLVRSCILITLQLKCQWLLSQPTAKKIFKKL